MSKSELGSVDQSIFYKNILKAETGIDYEYVGIIDDELMNVVKSAPALEPKNLYVEAKLETMFGEYNWTRSFKNCQLIVYDEVISSEILIIMHQWLRRKSADIENIVLVINHHPGIKNWWEKWCLANYEISFKIKELPFLYSPQHRKLDFDNRLELPGTEFYKNSKKILKLFSYYGGTHPSLERNYLFLKMVQFAEIAEVDHASSFFSRSEIIDYVEHITYYKNQTEVDCIFDAYNKHVDFKSNKYIGSPTFYSKAEQQELLAGSQKYKVNFSNYDWATNKHCLLSVTREAGTDSDKYATVTEKTMKSFLHHLIVMPLGFETVINLEKLNFWFPHELIDYSYQHEPIFFNRVDRLVKELKDIDKKYTLEQLQEFYVDNFDKFCHNAQTVQDLFNQGTKFDVYLQPEIDYELTRN
jgi:hypothetical protein